MKKQKGSILIIDSQPDRCFHYADLIRHLGYDVLTAFTYADGILITSAKTFNIYIIGDQLPDGIILKLFEHIRIQNNIAPFIITNASDQLTKELMALASDERIYFQPDEDT